MLGWFIVQQNGIEMDKPLYKLLIVKGPLFDPIGVFEKDNLDLSMVKYILDQASSKPVSFNEPFETLTNVNFKTKVGRKSLYYSIRRTN